MSECWVFCWCWVLTHGGQHSCGLLVALFHLVLRGRLGCCCGALGLLHQMVLAMAAIPSPWYLLGERHLSFHFEPTTFRAQL